MDLPILHENKIKMYVGCIWKWINASTKQRLGKTLERKNKGTEYTMDEAVLQACEN